MFYLHRVSIKYALRIGAYFHSERTKLVSESCLPYVGDTDSQPSKTTFYPMTATTSLCYSLRPLPGLGNSASFQT